MLVLTKNKERIEINKSRLSNRIVIKYAKKTVKNILENLVKQQQSIKDINNINFNKELCESQQNRRSLKCYLVYI